MKFVQNDHLLITKISIYETHCLLTSPDESPHFDRKMWSDSSSTMTNEGDTTTVETTSPDLPINHTPLPDTGIITTPSTPSPDDLEAMRRQGAIPKKYPTRSLPTVPSQTSTDGKCAYTI